MYSPQKNIEIIVHRNPFCIQIKNVFGKALSKKILNEFIVNKKRFVDATVTNGSHDKNVVDKTIRSNVTMMYDNHFRDRSKSVLLKNEDEFIASDFLRMLLSSAPSPLRLHPLTNYTETQVSRYGNTDQKYDWHIDPIGGVGDRIITCSYYVCAEPKKFSGGQIVLSDGLYFKDRPVGETRQIEFEIENDMCVIFDSRTLHCVKPTKSPKNFADGRFSVQMWVGIRK